VTIVRIPPPFREFTAGGRATETPGSDMRQILLSLSLRHPGIGGYVFREDGEQPDDLNIFLNSEEIRTLAGLDTPVKSQDEVVLLPAIFGSPLRPRPIPLPVGLDLDPDAARELDLRIQAVTDELIRLLAERPDYLYQLAPRQFEELMAEIFERQGFDVTLTPKARDGGVDLFLVKRTPIGNVLTLVELKRYRADRPVGVGVVRQLFGVVESKRATAGVVTTTSFFTRDARRFQEEVPFRLALQDFGDVRAMLKDAARLQRGASATE
jgi:molybdopterin converting factor small subunit